ncbi:SDR family oxidoreductase [Streptomyces sp. NPDC088553]|uniref:SDR family oxidoreductase n=1 Tax=Streptomyces sp. NPDC088553 TaxID=3365864 RepID=UPI0037F6EA28
MIFRVLGPFTVPGAAGEPIPVAGGPKVRALLALLLLDAGRTVSVDRLVDGLYGEEPPAGAAGALQAQVSRLRRVLPPGAAVEMETFTRTLANVVGERRITVNTVAPGPTQTAELTAAMAAMPQLEGMLIGGQALPWVGQPEDIADPVAFLASEDGRWITGTVIDASGGTYLGPKR